MKSLKQALKAVQQIVMVRYHRRMASWYRKAAVHHADLVIHTLNVVPNASLAKLRGIAKQHDQKAKALRIGE
jgi:hypothetical protein